MNVAIQTLEADKKRLLAENNADLEEAEKEVIQNSEFLSLECQCCFWIAGGE
jgi:gamma-glutamyl phosphate reductase